MDNYDGKIVIGTAIETKELEKEIAKTEKELEKFSKEEERLLSKKTQLEIDTQKSYGDLEKIDNKLTVVNQKIKNMESVNLPEKLTTENVDYLKLINQRQELNTKAEEYLSKLDLSKNKLNEINEALIKNNEQQEKAKELITFDKQSIKAIEFSKNLEDLYSEYNKIQQAKIFTDEDIERSEELKNKMLEIAEEYKNTFEKELHIKGITDIKEDLEEIEPGINKTNKGFDKLINKIKKVGLSLFGIRSAYALVSRASSAYLSQDTELAQKLQSVWVGLGSFLAPALEAISDGLLKALGYLNVFIKALTGVDYIARANAKSLKKQADAQKQLAAGIDEVTNLQESASGGKPSGLIEVPELDDKIVKKLQNLARAIKENEDALKLLGIAFGAVLGYKAIKGIISNIGLLVGSKGLGSIPRSITISLALAGVAAIMTEIKLIKGDLEELDGWTGAVNKAAKKIGQNLYKNETNINKLLKDNAARRKTGLKTLEKTKTVSGSIFGIDKNYLENISSGIKVNEAILDNLTEQYKSKKLTKEEQEKILQELIDTYNYNISMIDVLKKNGIKTADLEKITDKYGDTIGEISDGLGYTNDKLNEMVIKSANANKETKGIYDNIKAINDQKLTDKEMTVRVYTELETKKAETQAENFFGKLGQKVGDFITLKTFRDWIEKDKNYRQWLKDLFSGNFLSRAGKGGGGGSGHGFADGGIIPTIPLQGVVYNPGPGVNIGGGNIAGERGAEVVFPLQNSKFIDAFVEQLAGKLGDGTNTQLLLELNRNIAELADRPIVLNVNGKSFAQATYQDYQNEQKRQNDNTQIVRS